MSQLPREPRQELYDFARAWMGRELDEQERTQLDAFAASLPAGSAGQAVPGQQTANFMKAEKQRVQAVIDQMLQGAQDAAQGNAQAQRAAEQAVLDAVTSARTLNDLRPSSLRPASEGETPAAQLLIAQIADRLGNLVKAEVESCFEHRFGSLASQIQAVLHAMHAGTETDPVAAPSQRNPQPPDT